MVHRFPRLLTGLFASATLLGACAAPAASAPSASTAGTPAASVPAASASPATTAGPPILIGLNVDYTGASAFEGHGVAQGAELAFEQINAKGGVNGHQIKWVLGDNQCDPSVGINAIRSLISSNVVGMIGSNCSSVTLAQMPILKSSQVPMVSVTDASPKITEQAGVGGNPWEFRINVNDDLLTATLGKQVIVPAVKRLAVLSQQTDHGHAVVNAIQTNVPGVTIVSVDYFQLGQSDYRGVLTKYKSLNIDGLLIGGDYPEASSIINQMHEVGLTNVKLFSRGITVTNQLFKLLGNPHWADGIVEATWWAPGLADSQYLADAYKARWNAPLDPNGGVGYFGALTLIQALQSISGDVTRQAVRDALEKVNFDIAGFGHVQFDDHHQAHPAMILDGVTDGAIHIIKSIPTS